MRRKRRIRKAQLEVALDSSQDPAYFDDVLNRELDVPTIIELDDEMAFTGPPIAGASINDESGVSDIARVAPNDAVDSTDAENALLRAELLATPSAPSHQPVTSDHLRSDPILAGVASTTNTEITAARTAMSMPAAPPLGAPDTTPPLRRASTAEPEVVPSSPPRWVNGFEQYDFWDRYEEATALAELFTVPPAAITMVIGSLDVAVIVAERCQAHHWVSECDVFVLTEQEHVIGQPTWNTVRRPSDLVAILEDGQSDFPLLVIDVPRELPGWIRPLVSRLRAGGVGLVHYVLGDSPSDEDLATWHGELDRPSVLDLASPVNPGRVLELLDRGEPVSSVAGMPISTELLLALRLNDA